MTTEYKIRGEEKPPSITFATNPLDEPMLTISDKGFWVRGVKVEQGPDEAQQVYDAFLQWMAWSALNRQY
jgi:hypothetical protein